MYGRVTKSEDGTSRIVWRAGPGDLPVTGTRSDGRRTTFSTNGNYQFTARNIHEDEAFWLGAILPCVSVACIAWMVVNGSPEQENLGALFFLSIVGVMLLAASIREEAAAWKEVLFIIATVSLIGYGGREGTLWFIIPAYGFLLARYAWLWKQRAVWEPFVSLTLFCGALLGAWNGILPNLFAPFVFVCIAALSIIGLLRVLTSSWTYSHGINSIRE